VLVLSCKKRISEDEAPVNHLLELDWTAFCVMASHIVEDQSLANKNWDSTFFARLHAYRPFARSRVTMAFIDQTDLIGPQAHDFLLFRNYAYEAGGFDFSCPALRRVLPIKPPLGCIMCDEDSTATEGIDLPSK
jgi:hypothetical protein